MNRGPTLEEIAKIFDGKDAQVGHVDDTLKAEATGHHFEHADEKDNYNEQVRERQQSA